MGSLGLPAIGFAAPWLLWALAALPVIWLLLRVMPPAPVLRRFPGVALLLGLTDQDQAAARTPPWLLALRALALAAAILGFAGPVLNPSGGEATGGGPQLFLVDASWADAPDWPGKRRWLAGQVATADRQGRPAALVVLTAPVTGAAPVFGLAADLAPRAGALEPAAWEPPLAAMQSLAAALPDGAFDTLWLSDGVERAGRAELAAALAGRGRLTVAEGALSPLALRPPRLAEGGAIAVPVLRRDADPAQAVTVTAMGLDPTGIERPLATATADLAAGAVTGQAHFDLPSELRNRVTRFELAGAQRTAGGVALAGDGLRRRKVALVASTSPGEGLEILSPLLYPRQALAPVADVIEGGLADLLPAAPDMIVLADVARLPPDDAAALAAWVEKGGLLLRFAGPRLAAAVDPAAPDDPLLPVRLRPGNRAVGGAMSWGAPRTLAPFAKGSLFDGLAVPDEVTVTAQVLADPGPDLSARTLAALADGTPLVTRKALGEGQVVLVHVTANADWSSLPLSGLFPAMLDRLALSAGRGAEGGGDAAAALAGGDWLADRVLDAWGQLAPAEGAVPQPAARLTAGTVGPGLPPGLYRSGDRRAVLNAIGPDRALTAARWPAGTLRAALDAPPARPLKGAFLAAALALMLADILATLALAGQLGRRARALPLILLTLTLPALAPAPARAADADPLQAEAGGMVLAHVLTGDATVDRLARDGLRGLSFTLTLRTSVEPGEPVAVNLDRDDISLLPFLYWPITADQPTPSPAAYRRLDHFLKSGGLILFDTRDAAFGGGAAGAETPEGRRLAELAAPLGLPPLEILPEDHVLTRSFYLLQEFPGRAEGPVWAEAAPPDAEEAEGMPFRRLNDGVTPVVIGGNDWAAAWAMDEYGQPLYPVGRGLAGDRQREIAFRFGVNLIMHVMTGNYKSDQVHVPALLERLGQ